LKFYVLLLFFFLLQQSIFSQVETIPADNYIYDFLKGLSVKGIISNYDDMVLPLSKRKVTMFLNEAESKQQYLSDNEKSQLEKFRIKLDLMKSSLNVSFTDTFTGEIKSFLDKNSAKYLYAFKDSSFNLYSNPILENDFIYSQNDHGTTNLFNFGIKMYGSYGDWFGFYMAASNGYQSGNRTVAELDQAVNQSFSFNSTKISYFDYTTGYTRIEKGNIGLEIGRERILVGRGINKLLISNNAPIFDFIRLNADFGILSIDYLNGWLVQPTYYTFDAASDSYFQNKDPKYIVISRFGLNPSSNFSFGITQSIIYANRPLELAYLNPFLFLESAQRSLNDLDNSFLAFDLRYKIINGLELSSIIDFDDIDVKSISTDGFGSLLTRYGWESNITLTNPILPENLIINMDYLILRPYLFSHQGIGESLMYTNNGFLIGPDVQPNSIKTSIRASYIINQDLILRASVDNIRHGDNTYDENGNEINNVGGNVFDFIKPGGNKRTKILDGIYEVTNQFSVNLEYEFIIGFYLGFQYDFANIKKEGTESKTENNIWGVFRYNIL